MRKLAVIGTVGLVMASVGSSAIAVAATTTKVLPKSVQTGITPPHRLQSPYKYTVSGTIIPPSEICPAGTTDPSYCTNPRADECTGKVAVTVRLGPNKFLANPGKVVDVLNGTVASDCTFSVSETVPDKALTAKKHIKAGKVGGFAGIYFTVRFLGNTVLLPESGNTQIVLAKVINPPKS